MQCKLKISLHPLNVFLVLVFTGGLIAAFYWVSSTLVFVVLVASSSWFVGFLLLDLVRRTVLIVTANVPSLDSPPLQEPDSAATIIAEDAPPLIVPPSVVRYSSIKNQIPPNHILVGMGLDDTLITKDSWVGALTLIVGMSGTGKTSTTLLRIHERFLMGHQFLVVDPHAFKPDSLKNAFGPYTERLIQPIAADTAEITNVLMEWLRQFDERKNGGSCKKPVTLIVDETSSLCDPLDDNEAVNMKLCQRIARIAGQEARNFNMAAIFISQQVTGLAWLRKCALMIIVHQLLMKSEQKIATNDNYEVMMDMQTWPIGRTLVYGVGFSEGPQVVQQPLLDKS